MNFIFNYKIVKNKIGFPFSALENVLDALNDKEIDYIVKELSYLIADTLNRIIQYD